ncbi:MAG: ABC transporter permease [Bacteroidales bacterium]|nr:ABC transporter permease [Bacteroidales bacterium]MCB9013988.1 ABC transporter permease [Bacteroidales bacterium]
MRILISILRKEFIQIFRNRVMLPFIFIVPVVQMVVLVFAANLELKEVKLYTVDLDLSETSRKLRYDFTSSPFYNDQGTGFSITEGEKMLLNDKADLVIVINKGFEENLRKENSSQLQLLINAINTAKAGLVNAYSESIVRDFNQNIRLQWMGVSELSAIKNIDVSYSYWYNPELNYKIYMLPGIMVILVTIIGMFLAALNLVREKELGTAEQINVTPIRKFHFIIGKLLPFWIIALFELGFGLTIGKVFFHLPVLGNPALLFGFAAVYLAAVLGIGLLLSTMAETQQQVMFLAFFFLLTFILMSGIFTAVESMPDWAQKVNVVNPFAYFMRVIRMILLKGSQFHDIQKEFLSMFIYACASLSMAVWRYRKIN